MAKTILLFASLQTKRAMRSAIYLTKTPFQLTLAIIQEWECFDTKNHLEKLRVFVFRYERKILLTLFGEHIFHLANLSTLGLKQYLRKNAASLFLLYIFRVIFHVAQ